MICGFLMIYVVEELAHMVLHKLKEDQHHHKNERENSNQVNSSEEPTTTTTTTMTSSSVSSSKSDLPNGDYTHEDIKPEIFVPDDFQVNTVTHNSEINSEKKLQFREEAARWTVCYHSRLKSNFFKFHF